MGKSYSVTGNGVTIPQLAALVGLTHTRLYQVLGAGRGPTLTTIVRSPVTARWGKPNAKPAHYVTWDDALAWVEDQLTSAWLKPERREQLEQAAHKLRIERAYHRIRTGWRPDYGPYISTFRRGRGHQAEQPADVSVFIPPRTHL